ncbi:uncharacterized protein LOC110976941 [Acanthaster planci]|uniref:Uncharacterized protein LOC110976941 n=1 Tax=Acanthaster planci TaxID=133434 RepID=A0A8B7Y1G2_ACAPL|nr:uncharacterized protein LOC110976941 [Acanthaster planci]XP_022086361.1 uncharacterized protein LOC110976941 [Acanthaster planci]XP_022086362.1 uncharacterized protein LOC110976941 [Acanthaster planci]XP_022086363.1 uncharacterized protein LOC110976941 [Acanthaster planci]
MESPAIFRGSTIVTTALIHSSSPPGFVADEKDLSPSGGIKAHNGCVVREKDQIILLKRVYTSPSRRSSRVRRKGCVVLPRSKVKHRYSDPVVYPHAAMRTTAEFNRSYPMSAGNTPVRTGKRDTSEDRNHLPTTRKEPSTPNIPTIPISPATPGLTPHGLTLSDNVTESDFFTPDGTPKRRLVVRLSETPEIRKKLAEIGTPLFSPHAEYSDDLLKGEEALPHVNLASRSIPHTDHCEARTNISQQVENNHNAADLTFDEERTPLQTWRPATIRESHLECVLDSAEILEDEMSVISTSSSNTLDIVFDNYQSVLNSRASSPQPDTESIGSCDELKGIRDLGDEVMCISPLPFQTPDTAHEDGESDDLNLYPPEFLPSASDEAPDDFEIVQNYSSTIESPSFIGAGSPVSSQSPLPIMDGDLGKRNQHDTSPSLVLHQTLHKMNCTSPVNGIRGRQVLRVSLSPQTFGPYNCFDLKASEKSDLQDDVCIVNITPSHKVDTNKGKEPSPTYATQANFESPGSPGSTSFVSTHAESEYHTPRASSLQSLLKNNYYSTSPATSASSKIFLNQQDDFQDFSDFDFASAQGALLTQAFSPVVVTEKLSQTSLVNVSAKSSSAESCSRVKSPLSHFGVNPSLVQNSSVHQSSASKNAKLTTKEKGKCRNWTEMLEDDTSYHEESTQGGIGTRSEDSCTSTPNFLRDECCKLSRGKETDRAVQRRSSLRIAKRMSLLTLEAQSKQSDGDEDDSMPVSESGPPKMSKAVQKQSESSVHGRETVPKRKRGRPPLNKSRVRCQTSGGPHVVLDKCAVRVENSSTFSGLDEESDEMSSQEPASIIPSEGQLHSSTYGTITQVNSKTKPKAGKRSKQLRRRSARLNPIVLPLSSKRPSAIISNATSVSKQALAESRLGNITEPPSLSSCSESVSTEEDFQYQFGDHSDSLQAERKTKRQYKLPRRRSARLNSVGLPVTRENPIVISSEPMTSESHDLGPASSNSKSAAPKGVSGETAQDVESSNCSLVEPARGSADTELISISEYIAPFGEGKKRGSSKRRRRSSRLLKLSLMSLDEEQPASDQTLPEETSVSSGPEKGSTDSGQDGPLSSSDQESSVQEKERECTSSLDKNQETKVLNNMYSCGTASSGSPGVMLVDINAHADLAGDPLDGSDLLENASAVSAEGATAVRRPRRRKSVHSYSEKTKESKPKKQNDKTDEEAVKELYLKRGECKVLKPSNLETIFEELHFNKRGSPLYTASRKCKRAVHFPEHPWLPRKKKKTAKNSSSRSKGKKKTSKDPNIDMKLEALLAELTPASSPTSELQADNVTLLCCGASHADFSTSQSVSNCPASAWSENSSSDLAVSNIHMSNVGLLLQTAKPTPKTIRKNGEVELEADELVLRKPNRDTPFKGSASSGKYGAMLNRLLKNNVVRHEESQVGEVCGEAMQD